MNLIWNIQVLIRLLLISLGIFVSIILLLIPLLFIFKVALSGGLEVVIRNIMNKETLHAMLLTILIVLIVIPINIFFGLLVSWLISRFQFFGRQFFLTMLSIPIAVSPVVVGLTYLLLYNNTGFLGSLFNFYNVQIIFSWPGMVLVTIFVTFPFIAQTLIPSMIYQGNHEDEAAILLGASGWRMFRLVTFPNISRALVHGIVLTYARIIGEFGAVSVVSGLIRGETYTLSLQIELLYQNYNIVGAFVSASLLALISIIILMFKNFFQRF